MQLRSDELRVVGHRERNDGGRLEPARQALEDRAALLARVGQADDHVAFADAREVAEPDAPESVVPEHPDALRLMTHALMRRAGERAPGDAREHLHARALACLVRAVDIGYDNRPDLERTPQLAPLRELSGYPTLGAE